MAAKDVVTGRVGKIEAGFKKVTLVQIFRKVHNIVKKKGGEYIFLEKTFTLYC